MGVKEGEKRDKGDITKYTLHCDKGDIPKDTLRYDILVERSSTKDDVTILLWKAQDDRFEVARYNGKERTKEERWGKPILPYNKDEALARRIYEDSCGKPENGCSPYPEAEAYYRGIHKSKGIAGLLKSLDL